MLFSKISESEKKAIERYIETYAESAKSTHRSSLESVLREWNYQKSNLYKLLGNKLIYTKNICLERSLEMIKYEMEFAFSNDDFIDWLNDVCSFYRNDVFNLKTDSRFVVQDLYSFDCLAKNVYTRSRETIVFTDENLKPIQVQNGCKPMRILHQIAKNFGKEEEFETFRLKHSMILNEKKFEGELSLSIHPLDYMTMSDNNSNWSSCMSWQENGCYRRGTVEMMNSNCVIVAYLSSKKPMSLFPYDNFTWNNKRWRELYIVNDQIITNVKGYPFRSLDLTKEVLKILKELAEQNCGYKYHDNHIEFETIDNETLDIIEDEKIWENGTNIAFETNTMYNDFDSAYHYGYIAEDMIGLDFYINYSGVETCMWCGGPYRSFYHGDDKEACLCCDSCYDAPSCENCGTFIEESIYHLDGMEVCEDCFESYAAFCIDDEEYHHKDNVYKIYLAKSKDIYFNIGRSYFFYVYDLDMEFLDKYFTGEIHKLEENNYYYEIEQYNFKDIENLFWNHYYLERYVKENLPHIQY